MNIFESFRPAEHFRLNKREMNLLLAKKYEEYTNLVVSRLLLAYRRERRIDWFLNLDRVIARWVVHFIYWQRDKLLATGQSLHVKVSCAKARAKRIILSGWGKIREVLDRITVNYDL